MTATATLESCVRLLDAILQGQTGCTAADIDACRKLAVKLRREGLRDGAVMIEDRLRCLPSARVVSPRLKARHIIAAIDAFTDDELQGLDAQTRFELWTAVSTLDEALADPDIHH